MAVIRPKRNIVCALDPLPEDTLVQTLLGNASGQRVLCTRPIEEYDAAVNWAISMADVMAHTIVVMPITTEEFLDANRERLEQGLASLSEPMREALRQVAIASMQDVAQNCPAPEVRADALTLLYEMRTIQ